MDFLLNATIFERSDNVTVSSPVPDPPLYIVVVASILYGLTFLFGIVGNLMVIVVIYKYRSMRSRMNLFLVNLSLADLFILLMCVPSAALDLFAKEVWYFGEAMCKMVPFFEQVVTLSSVLTILAITWDRYKGICYPLHYNDQGKNITVQLLLVWSTSFISSTPFLFIPVFKDSRFRDGTPITVCRMPIDELWEVSYIVAICVSFFGLTFCTLLFLYVRIWLNLNKSRKFINLSAEKYAKKISKDRRQMVKVMLIVIVMFFCCLIPQKVVGLWLVFASRLKVAQIGFEGYLHLKTFPRVLVYMNSVMNPLIYNFVSTKFRLAFRKLLLCHPEQTDRRYTNCSYYQRNSVVERGLEMRHCSPNRQSLVNTRFEIN